MTHEERKAKELRVSLSRFLDRTCLPAHFEEMESIIALALREVEQATWEQVMKKPNSIHVMYQSEDFKDGYLASENEYRVWCRQSAQGGKG